MSKSNMEYLGEQNAITQQEILVGHNTLSFDQSVDAGDMLLPGIYVDITDNHEIELVSVDEVKQTVVINISDNPDVFSPIGLGINNFKATYKRK